MKEKFNITAEVVKSGRILALISAVILVPFLISDLPLFVILLGAALAVIGNLTETLALKKRPDLTLSHPLLISIKAVYVSLITVTIYYTGGLQSHLFPLYFLLAMTVSPNARALGWTLAIAVAEYVYITFPQWGGSTVNFSILVQRVAFLFLISLFTVFLNRKVAEETKELEKSKEDIVSIVSHELRAPLTSIIGYITLILGGKVGDVNEKQKTFLESVLSQGKKLEKMVSNILNLAHPEFFKGEDGSFNMAELIKETTEKFQVAAQKSNLSLKTNLARSQMKVQGDASKIEQVLNNLLENALRFTDKGSVEVKMVNSNNQVLVQVTDTGPGIPPEHLSHIFEKFYQVSNALTRAKGGTGLGLAICKEIVEARGGKIWASSVAGKGSTFNFTLPLRREGEGGGKKK